MAIDTVAKRRSALGVTTWLLPAADSEIDSTERALLLRAYIPFAVSDVVTPLRRTLAIASELRVLPVSFESRVYPVER